jgi:hypothetical protein
MPKAVISNKLANLVEKHLLPMLEMAALMNNSKKN